SHSQIHPPPPLQKIFFFWGDPPRAVGGRRGVCPSARTFTLTLTLSLKGEGTDRAQILRDIFFCLVTEEQKIGLLRLNIAEKKHGRE
ncbi:hypothetical protein U4W18_13595, partial [Escherichia coli]|nr:hypothetical protein [Escherichia coli]